MKNILFPETQFFIESKFTKEKIIDILNDASKKKKIFWNPLNKDKPLKKIQGNGEMVFGLGLLKKNYSAQVKITATTKDDATNLFCKVGASASGIELTAIWFIILSLLFFGLMYLMISQADFELLFILLFILFLLFVGLFVSKAKYKEETFELKKIIEDLVNPN